MNLTVVATAAEGEREMHVNTLGLCNCHASCSVLLYLAPRLVEVEVGVVLGGHMEGDSKRQR